MDKHLQDRLLNTYPLIFQGKDKTINESLIPFGFECGNGWYPLIDCLCHEIQIIIDNGDRKYIAYPFGMFLGKLFRTTKLVGRWIKKDIPQVEAVQVKEKFGGLRFYYQGGNIEVESAISLAENLSFHICEDCGSMNDVIQTRGWIKTLCKACLNKEPS